MEVFTASDSLGWCYQFWQAERKDEVNAAGNKIGADELPAVTQLFTEDYMVDFLLDNTLGAWHAGKVLAANPKLAENAQSEDELRQAVALPGCPWKYLRFIKGKDGKWTPAAGTFDGWPKTAKELKCLDPCMGSGHFVVAMFERLVALRMAEEKLDEAAAVAAVIRDNLFGLEIDPRCTQIGAFNLALAAWRRVGHCKLPAMNLACSGLAPNTREADWLAIAGDNEKLQRGMERLYRLFQKAPVLGSLINPRAGEGDLLVAAFHELQPLLEKALAQETKDDTAHEMAVTARGLAKAAEILAGQFTLVATNVPYLGRSKQDEVLKDYCERVHPMRKPTLRLVSSNAVLISVLTAEAARWSRLKIGCFLADYKKLRRQLLDDDQIGRSLQGLVRSAFETISGEVVNVAACHDLSRKANRRHRSFAGIDVATTKPTPQRKADRACVQAQSLLQSQDKQLENPDARIAVRESERHALCSKIMQTAVKASQLVTISQFSRSLLGSCQHRLHGGSPCNSHVDDDCAFGGSRACCFVARWNGDASMQKQCREGVDIADGHEAWGKRGVAVSQMRDRFRHALYGRDFRQQRRSRSFPTTESILPAFGHSAQSTEFREAVRTIDQKLNVTNATLCESPLRPCALAEGGGGEISARIAEAVFQRPDAMAVQRPP